LCTRFATQITFRRANTVSTTVTIIPHKGASQAYADELVKSMVRRYMDNPRSAMLVVIPANVDIATQEILTLAEEADPDGHRILGVLTKPDLVRMQANNRETV